MGAAVWGRVIMTEEIEETVEISLEISPESAKRIDIAAAEIMLTLEDKTEDPLEALQAIAILSVYIICNHVAKRDMAYALLDILSTITVKTLRASEEAGHTKWSSHKWN